MRRSLMIIGSLSLIAGVFWLTVRFVGYRDWRASASSHDAEARTINLLRDDEGLVDRELRYEPSRQRLPAPQQPLPPLSAPFSTTFPELKHRAEKGDFWAQCQLAVELIRCRDAMRLIKDRNKSESLTRTDFSSISNAAAREFFESNARRRFAAIVASAEQCADVPEAEYANAQRYLREAGKAGLSEAALMYLEGRGLDHGDFAQAIGDPEFANWYQFARSGVEARVREGDPKAVWVMIFASTKLDQTPLDALVGDDAEVQRLYSRLGQLLRDGTLLDNADPSLPPSRVSAINAQAMEMFKKHFGARAVGESAMKHLASAASAEQAKSEYGCQTDMQP